MKVTVYHELTPDDLKKIESEGLRCATSGEKTDRGIEKINLFLDTYLPDNIRQREVSRSTVVYAFLKHDGNKMQWCADPDGKECFMDFHRILP